MQKNSSMSSLFISVIFLQIKNILMQENGSLTKKHRKPPDSRLFPLTSEASYYSVQPSRGLVPTRLARLYASLLYSTPRRVSSFLLSSPQVTCMRPPGHHASSRISCVHYSHRRTSSWYLRMCSPIPLCW